MIDDSVVLVFDLDSTICYGPKVNGSHAFKKPNRQIIDEINKCHDMGYTIIIETARGMGSNHNDEGKALKASAEDTLRWLRENNVMYDSIKFSKSFGAMYVDDKAIRPYEFMKYGVDGCKNIIKDDLKKFDELTGIEE